MLTVKVSVEKTGTGYSAYTDQFPGVVSTGKVWEDVKQHFTEAFEFHLEGMKAEGEAVPDTYKLEFGLDVDQLLGYYRVFNVTALAEYLGMNAQLLHQYKDGHKQPSEKTSLKILAGLHAFGEELLSVK